MGEKCQLVETCPIALYFLGENWDRMLNCYCYGNFNKCARYQIHEDNQIIPELLMPWNDLTEINAEASSSVTS
jgi:hypothetical protein